MDLHNYEPCPLCGRRDGLRRYDGAGRCFIRCDHCKLKIHDYSPDHLLIRWNFRPLELHVPREDHWFPDSVPDRCPVCDHRRVHLEKRVVSVCDDVDCQAAVSVAGNTFDDVRNLWQKSLPNRDQIEKIADLQNQVNQLKEDLGEAMRAGYVPYNERWVMDNEVYHIHK